ncbi:MAG: hypothetical protein WC911_08650 [Thermoleophilia bacterium]
MEREYSREKKEAYEAPAFEKFGNLLNITADWQCSAIFDTHSNGNGNGNGYGHCSHGNGNGNGHNR